ncbi:VOC family protein [Roseateles violae]|uniref:VOC family protein n=1 Tax=Roseateles violae TaxID=3058042 RepID=A0ABT8DQS8_9BURK|nr:VOC family protein [Pelomonas sp. PFR6]MDN3919438.1 VOC family protein [Pelomonas sp. PFR6]
MESNRSMPRSQIIPELAYPDVHAATQWLIEAFGFSVRLRIGSHRAQLEFGSGALVLRAGPAPTAAESACHSIMVRVDDVDAHYARAVAAGAKVFGIPTTHPYGERQYAAQDLAGHCWVFSQSVADVPPSEWGGELVSKPDAD